MVVCMVGEWRMDGMTTHIYCLQVVYTGLAKKSGWANEELGTDILTMHGFEHYRANDYLLAFAHPTLVAPTLGASAAAAGSGSSSKARQRAEEEEPLYYVVSPKDVVVGRPRDG
eukprot:6895438-Pyramimonas_sp.AAC.1